MRRRDDWRRRVLMLVLVCQMMSLACVPITVSYLLVMFCFSLSGLVILLFCMSMVEVDVSDSDHSSWKRAGYRSAFAMETEFHSSNPNIHTSRDDIDNVDFTWMAEFVKVGIGMAGELAGAE